MSKSPRDAIRAASRSHHFLSVTQEGHSAISTTKGNKSCHLILRGGNGNPNYAAEHLDAAAALLSQAALPPRMMVDCSHANSGKDYRRQPAVAAALAGCIAAGDLRIIGAMI